MSLQIERKWFVVLASLMSQAVFLGIPFSAGILFSEWCSSFPDVPRRSIAWIVSINTGVILLFAPIGGILVERFGLHVCYIIGALVASLSTFCAVFSTNIYHLLISFGFGTGLGCAIAMTPSSLVVNMHFKRHRMLANGITTSGAGLGVLVWSPIMKFLIDQFFWPGCVLLLSAIFVQSLVLWPAMRTAPTLNSPDTTCDPKSRSVPLTTTGKVRRMFHCLNFHIFVSATSLWCCAATIPLSMIYDAALSLGHPKWRASIVMTLTGAGSASSRVLIGAIYSFQQRISIHVVQPLSCLVSGVCMFLLPVIGWNFACLAILGLVHGLCFGAQGSAAVPVVFEILPMALVVFGYAWTGMFNGVFVLISPPIAGLIYDETQNYGMAFVFSGSCFIAAFVLFTVILYRKTRSKGNLNPGKSKDGGTNLSEGQKLFIGDNQNTEAPSV